MSVKKIAVLTSGGDAPGMNAAIRAIVRTASYHGLEIYGVRRGYNGLIKGDMVKLTKRSVGNTLHRGGTFLKTSRSEDFRTEVGRKKAYKNLCKKKIDGLIVIGGDGTLTGAELFSTEFNMPVIGVPATIDNDLYGSDLTIGFDTAVNTAIEAVDRIRDTADSHDRVFFIEVMGRSAGYIALQTGIATGAASIMIPEIDMKPKEVIDMIKVNLKRKKLFNLVIVAEGTTYGNVYDIEKIVKETIPHLDMRVSIIGHLQRGGSPSAADRVLASRLGYSAVNGLIKGRTGEMVGIKNEKIKYTPMLKAVHGKKFMNKSMIEMSKILGI
ncbi:UNVERIFIED_CONTAM: hypothetical protein GTU68_009101 [Idotea baltica]|nr:hypothetical protein [Idotea baltica]